MAQPSIVSDRYLNSLLRKLDDDDESVRDRAMTAICKLKERRDIKLQLIAAAARTFRHMTSMCNSFNYELLEMLSDDRDPRMVSAVEQIYDSLEGKKDGRMAALRILIEQGGSRAMRACAKLLARPSSRTIELNWLYLAFRRRPKAALRLFPDLFAAIPQLDNPDGIYQLILELAEADVLSLDAYPQFVAHLRQALETTLDVWWKQLSGRTPRRDSAKFMAYARARDELRYLLDLARFIDDPALDRLLKRAATLPPDLAMFAAVSLLVRGRRVPKKDLERCAANANHRWRLWDILYAVDRLDAFPDAYRDQQLLAEADMVKWLEDPSEYGRPPEALRLIARVEAPGEEKHRVAFYFFAFRYSQRPEEAGVAGPYEVAAPPSMHGWKTFSKWSVQLVSPLNANRVEDIVFNYFSAHPFRLPGESVDRGWCERLTERDSETLAHIRKIDFGNESVEDSHLQNFGKLRSLESLDVHGTNVGDRGINALGALKRLRELNLESTRITDSALEQIARLSNLRDLDLTSTSVGDEGIRRLAKLKRLENLSLLYCNRITDAALVSLSQMPRLKEVAVHDTKITARALKTFRRKHPQIRVVD